MYVPLVLMALLKVNHGTFSREKTLVEEHSSTDEHVTRRPVCCYNRRAKGERTIGWGGGLLA